MKVCIIGGGASGLVAVKHCIEYGLECVLFEQTGDIGGAWVYVETPGKDEFGLPVISAMYTSLRTNLPKVLMEFRGFEFKGKSDANYPSYHEVYDYLHQFADAFDLKKHIKLYHHVILVARSKSNDVWDVGVKNLKADRIEAHRFDAVIVCNGHNSVPSIPPITGIEGFEGIVMHSHDYRHRDKFKDKRVLIIGIGPSGLDLCFEFHDVTKVTFISHHHSQFKRMKFPDNVVHKPDISHMVKNDVIFDDCSSEQVDAIIYCTGYKFSFLFLDNSCRINWRSSKFVSPLYKNLINAREPTMCFIGILINTFVFLLIDVQAHVFVKSLVGLIKLPTNCEMLKIWQRESEGKTEHDMSTGKFHTLGTKEKVKHYLEDLIRLGDLEPIPNVLFQIYEKNSDLLKHDYQNLRNLSFKVLDNENFSYSL